MNTYSFVLDAFDRGAAEKALAMMEYNWRCLLGNFDFYFGEGEQSEV